MRASKVFISLALLTTILNGGSACRDDELVTFKGRLLGVLCDPQTGEPAPGIPFRIESGGVVVSSDVTDDEGNITAGGLKDGAGVLIADFSAASGGERRLDIDPQGQLTTLFEDPACRGVPPAPGTGDISGVVCNRHTGSLVQGATITVILGDGSTVETVTDGDGNFLLFDVPVGEYALVVASESYRRTYAIEVNEGLTTSIPGDECGLPSLSTGLLSGTLCDPASGGALAGADVLVEDASGDQYLELTDDSGSFLVGPMAPGPARVHVTNDDGVVVDLVAIVVAGAEATVTNGGACVLLTCTDNVIEVPPLEPPELLLVVDRSGSMNAAAPGYGTTRWLGVKDALARVTASVDDRIAFGLMLFPALGGESGCSAANVDVVPALDAAAGIAAVLDDFDTEPLGATPTASSLRAVQTYVDANPSARARAVLLATDGAPNCNATLDPGTCRCSTGNDADCRTTNDAETCLDDADAVSAVTDLAAAGVATYVVGVPGVENFSDVLNAMATAGGTRLEGTNGFYLARDSATLEGAIRDISRRLSNCSVDVTGIDLVATSQVTVQIDDATLARDLDHVEGYDVVDSDTLTLFGAACDALAVGGSVSVNTCLLGAE